MGYNFLDMYMMDKKQKERIKSFYGGDEKITPYIIINSGIKIGTTTKAKLDKGLVNELED